MNEPTTEQILIRELQDRVDELERQVADWAPFINQMRTTIAQLAQNPMVLAMVPPQYRATLAQYTPPKD